MAPEPNLAGGLLVMMPDAQRLKVGVLVTAAGASGCDVIDNRSRDGLAECEAHSAKWFLGEMEAREFFPMGAVEGAQRRLGSGGIKAAVVFAAMGGAEAPGRNKRRAARSGARFGRCVWHRVTGS